MMNQCVPENWLKPWSVEAGAVVLLEIESSGGSWDMRSRWAASACLSVCLGEHVKIINLPYCGHGR